MESNDLSRVLRQFGIIGRSPLLMRAISAAIQAAPFDVSVLVCGENGTGKEVFHKIIHQFGPRRHAKCVAVNCGGLPEGTIDSELFGHVKGAYTGATSDRKGYFEEANGGTIFLDEIAELPLPTQARLLRILETGEYYRMGSSDVRKTDVRVVAATNVNLLEAIRKGTFREDLYYRLSTITIDVPPLRDRENDIFDLFRKFSGDVAEKYRMPAIQLDNEARRTLLAYRWPGNVRQLLHVVEHISIVELSPDNQERIITDDILRQYLPAFTSGIAVGGESASDQKSGFAPGEKEMLYKTILLLQRQLEEVRNLMGLSHTNGSNGKHNIEIPAQLASQNPVVKVSNPVVSPTVIDTPSHPVVPYADGKDLNDPMPLQEVEDICIDRSLERHGGNKRKAAEELGIGERTIHRHLQTKRGESSK